MSVRMSGNNDRVFGENCYKAKHIRKLRYLFSVQELTQDIYDALGECAKCVEYAKENGQPTNSATAMCCLYCSGDCQNPKCLHNFNESFRTNKQFLGME